MSSPKTQFFKTFFCKQIVAGLSSMFKTELLREEGLFWRVSLHAVSSDCITNRLGFVKNAGLCRSRWDGRMRKIGGRLIAAPTKERDKHGRETRRMLRRFFEDRRRDRGCDLCAGLAWQSVKFLRIFKKQRVQQFIQFQQHRQLFEQRRVKFKGCQHAETNTEGQSDHGAEERFGHSKIVFECDALFTDWPHRSAGV